mmetsp:Transcript_44731/g.97191  ORF Transcript_44731/g.97191 Transcript_44731/m.97191 type:complete len:86 (-) Transcript_44731:69-326(-)
MSAYPLAPFCRRLQQIEVKQQMMARTTTAATIPITEAVLVPSDAVAKGGGGSDTLELFCVEFEVVVEDTTAASVEDVVAADVDGF